MSEEVKPKPASEDPKSLQNGLGLDDLLKGDKPITKPSSKAPKAAEKVEAKGETPAAPAAKADEKDAKPAEPDTVDSLAKRLKDTRDYATKVDQRNKELLKKQTDLEKRLVDAEAKLNGTYVETPPIPPDQLVKAETFKARAEIDNLIMIEQYGAETIQKLIWDVDSPYQQLEIIDPAVRERVTNAKRPVAEAMKVLKEREFAAKYGNDPDRIREAILTEEREKLVAEIHAELKGKPIESVNSLSGVNGAPREVQREPPKAGAVPDLAVVFPTFHKANTA